MSSIDVIDNNALKISQIQAFVAVARQGNFSSAALEIGLSQSSVSHAIASLEEELGIMLFLRGRHGAVLTPEGQQLIQEAEQVLQLLDIMQHKARLAQGLENGQVRIATVRSIASTILPPVIEQFRAKFPTISIAISDYDRYADVEQALQTGHAEVGFTMLPTMGDFETWELLRDEFVALLPPSTLTDQAPLSWETLTCFPAILNQRSALHNKLIQDHITQQGYTLKVGYEVREDSTVMGMVKQGLGMAIMARLAAEPIPNGIQLHSLPIPLERVIGVAILPEAILPRSVFAFLDLLKEVWRP